jgi:hypothetical protein
MQFPLGGKQIINKHDSQHTAPLIECLKLLCNRLKTRGILTSD